MFHRHLSLERIELAREQDPAGAERLARRVAGCWRCSANLTHGAELRSTLSAWTLGSAAAAPADWQVALRRAIAPANAGPAAPARPLRRLAMVVLPLAALLLAAAVPAAASAGPGSVLYPVRGIEENARWSVTPTHDRPRLEAELASGYLWQARVSAGRHDSEGYRASMDRFFIWGERLKADVKESSPGDRPAIRATVTAASSLMPDLQASGEHRAENERAKQVLDDVQSQEGDRDQQGND